MINSKWIVVALISLCGCERESPENKIMPNKFAFSPGEIVVLRFPSDPLVTRIVIAKTTEELAVVAKAFQDHDHDRLAALEAANRVKFAIPGTRCEILAVDGDVVQVDPISRDKTIGWVGYVATSLCQPSDQNLTEEESMRPELALSGDVVTLLTDFPCVLVKNEDDLASVDDSLRTRNRMMIEFLCKSGSAKLIDKFPIHGVVIKPNIDKRTAELAIPGFTGFVSEYRIAKGKLAPRQPPRK